MLDYDKRLTQLRLNRLKKTVEEKRYINKGSYALLLIIIVLLFLFL